MGANKRRDGGAGMARALKAALMCVLLAAGGIGYVRQTMDQDRLGKLHKEQESRLLELQEDQRRQMAIHSKLTSPEMIRERVRMHRLNLSPATPQQRVFLSLPAPGASPLIGSRPAGGPPVNANPTPTPLSATLANVSP